MTPHLAGSFSAGNSRRIESEQVEEFGHGKTGLGDDAPQSSALEIGAAVDRHGDLPGRVARMDETAMAARGSGNRKPGPLSPEPSGRTFTLMTLMTFDSLARGCTMESYEIHNFVEYV